VTTCRLCGRVMRPTVQLRFDDGTPNGMDGYRCVDFCRGIYPSESIAVQSAMVQDMADKGWSLGGFTDPDTHEPLTLRQMFDRHATALAVCEEFNL
jgi:hypothetical protein